MYAWQVFDEDGRWGTISLWIGQSAVVLVARSREIAEGPMRAFAEIHRTSEGKPVRLNRFIPDPDFNPVWLD